MPLYYRWWGIKIINIFCYVQILYLILFETKYVDIVAYMVQQLFQKLVYLEDK